MKGLLVCILLVFGFGCLMGNKTAGHDVDFVKVPVTHVVHDQPPPREDRKVYVMPAVCKDLVATARKISHAAGSLDTKSTDQLDIISDARATLASGGNLTDIEERQRELQGKTVGAIERLSELQTDYRTQRVACLHATTSP